jgi:group I intron endonuclease
MIQNKVNNKIYIGQSVNIEKRWGDHKYELRGNRHGNEHLQNAWNIDGEDNFEFTIIGECDENQLNTMEEYYIFELMSYDRRVGYNKNYGGKSGRPTEEARKKNSEAQKGKHHTEETKKKMSETRKTVMNRPEVRKKISESLKGKTFSEDYRKKLSENNARYWKGKHHTEESNKKRSEALKGEKAYWYGKHHTEETRKKISEHNCSRRPEVRKKNSEAHKGKLGAKCPNSIPVVQLTIDGELVKVYDAAMEAERCGFKQSNISKCLRGERNKHGGYKWMYLSDYEAMKKEGAEK